MALQKIDALTSLRFFAAATIVAYHCRGHFGLPSDFLAPFELSQGVSFFFVLSGFILTFVYGELAERKDRHRFWLARFARVWPLHLTTFLLYIILLPEFIGGAQAAGADNNPAAIAGRALINLSLLQAWVPVQSICFSFNTVSWSISTEAFFYLAFPFLIGNFSRTWPYKLAGAFCLVGATATLANVCHLPMTSASGVSIHGLMYVNPLSRLFEFVLGMSVAHLYKRHLVGRSLPPVMAAGLEALALALVYLLTLNTEKVAHWLARSPIVGNGGLLWLEHAGVPVLAFAFLIAVVAWGRGPLAALLRLKPFVFLGEISFATYLLHRLFLHYYWNHFAPVQGPQAIAVYAGFLLLASYLCWAIVEVPCRQIIMQGRLPIARPTFKSLVAPAFGLCLMSLGFIAIWSGPALNRLSRATVTAGGASSPVDTGIGFDDNLLLVNALDSRDKRGLTLTLRWQALESQKLDSYINLRLLSENGTLVSSRDYRFGAREERVTAGEYFENKVFVPVSELTYVHGLAFNLVKPYGHSPVAKIVAVGSSDKPAYLQAGMVHLSIDHDQDHNCGSAQEPAVAGRQGRPVL